MIEVEPVEKLGGVEALRTLLDLLLALGLDRAQFLPRDEAVVVGVEFCEDLGDARLEGGRVTGAAERA